MFDQMDVEGEQYQIKPMNCPFHCLIYKDDLRSYRDLPIRCVTAQYLSSLKRSSNCCITAAAYYCPVDLQECVGVHTRVVVYSLQCTSVCMHALMSYIRLLIVLIHAPFVCLWLVYTYITDGLSLVQSIDMKDLVHYMVL
jgi:hypothetical protein